MSLFLLKRKGPVNYDEFEGFVVRAADEAQARALAATDAQKRYPEPLEDEEEYEQVAMWRLPAETSCEPVKLDAEPGVILSSFRAG